MPQSPDERLKSILGATPDCLDTDQLASMLEHDAREVEDGGAGREHVEHCAHCQAELALMRSFLEPRVTSEEEPHVNAIVRELRRRSPAASPWWKRLLAPRAFIPAVTVAAVALVVFVSLEQRHSGEVAINPADEVTRSQAIQVVSPVGDVTRIPKAITWKDVSGAASYRVRILEVDRTLLWGASTTATDIAIPAEPRSKIIPGKALLWDVQALDASGNVIATSGLTRFRLLPD